jgi:hypothetical protein
MDYRLLPQLSKRLDMTAKGNTKNNMRLSLEYKTHRDPNKHSNPTQCRFSLQVRTNIPICENLLTLPDWLAYFGHINPSLGVKTVVFWANAGWYGKTGLPRASEER